MGTADQTPLTGSLRQASQQELPEATRLFDLSNHGFDRRIFIAWSLFIGRGVRPPTAEASPCWCRPVAASQHCEIVLGAIPGIRRELPRLSPVLRLMCASIGSMGFMTSNDEGL